MTPNALRRDALIAALRDGGKRITKTKQAVIDILVSADRHFTVDEVAQGVLAELPDASLSTIYRILEELETFGLVEHTHDGHAGASYHVSGYDHGHVTCSGCRRIFEIPASLYADFSAEVLAETGVTLEQHHVALSGLCAQCRTDR